MWAESVLVLISNGMNRIISIGIGVFVLVLTASYFMLNNFNSKEGRTNLEKISIASIPATEVATMTLASSAFVNGGVIPKEFTCDANGSNPPLTFGQIPANARSLALFMVDRDVPSRIKSDGTWDHWVVFNMPTSTQGIGPDEQFGVATYGSNSSGQDVYQGPCPPSGSHRYFFNLYALDTMLDLPKGSTKKEVLSAMEGHIVGVAELIGTYERGK